MRFIVQVRIEPDSNDGLEPTVVDIAVVDRAELTLSTLGLSIAETKSILAGVQDSVVTEQCAVALAQAACCDGCGRRFAHKDQRRLVVRTLYGTIPIASPRWWTCPCASGRRSSFTPLARILPDRSTPELVLVQGKLAAHVSFAETVRLLDELLPVGRRLHASEPRRHVAAIAERIDQALGSEEQCFIEREPGRDLPRPEMPLVVTIDGGYVHSSAQTSRRDGWFQAVCGTVTKADGQVRRFGFVPNIDTRPRRRIHDTLIAQGMQPNQLVTFLSDGAVDLAGWTDLMAPTAEYILDWFHIAMRFTVLANTMKGLSRNPAPDPDCDCDCDDIDCDDIDPAEVFDEMHQDLASAKWHVWHGNHHRAEQLLCHLSFAIGGCADSAARGKAERFLDELRVYLRRNGHLIPSYNERRLAGEPISSATAEATVNSVIAKRMVKKQQMRWTPTGAHRLIQVRTRTLDGTLEQALAA